MNKASKKQYSTAEMMKTFGLGRNTLRLYEKMGLLIGMARTGSGYREFNEKHSEELQFILKAKDAGFTLNEIKALLEIVRTQKKMTCGTISQEIYGKVSEIEEQLRTLETKKIFLAEFLKTCGSKNKETECEVLSVGFSRNACCD